MCFFRKTATKMEGACVLSAGTVSINYSSAGDKSRPSSDYSRVTRHLEKENITARMPAARDYANETLNQLTYGIVHATAASKRAWFWADGGEFQIG